MWKIAQSFLWGARGALLFELLAHRECAPIFEFGLCVLGRFDVHFHYSKDIFKPRLGRISFSAQRADRCVGGLRSPFRLTGFRLIFFKICFKIHWIVELNWKCYNLITQSLKWLGPERARRVGRRWSNVLIVGDDLHGRHSTAAHPFKWKLIFEISKFFLKIVKLIFKIFI